MIYTLTLNPSIDYVVTTDKFNIGETNRARAEESFPGGKGINVSIVLNNLGIESTALAFAAGYTGSEIQRKVMGLGLSTDFVQLKEGDSRINVKIRIEGPEKKILSETELNGVGPEIKGSDMQRLYEKLEGLKNDDILVMSGSAPASLGSRAYADICRFLKKKGKKIITVIDAAGELLTNTLEYNPFLIKPNIRELEDIFDVEIGNRDQLIEYAGKLQKRGARNVIVSCAGDGALLLTENGRVFSMRPPKGDIVNSVGAGDSMVAGFMSVISEKLSKTGKMQDASQKKESENLNVSHENNEVYKRIFSDETYKEALTMGLCAGSASAFSEGLADRDTILRLYENYEKPA